MKMNEETHCALIQLWFDSNQHLTFHLRPLFLPERGKAKKKKQKKNQKTRSSLFHETQYHAI